ncbi:TetR/AcrR family transcriptional regulator [Mycolicibacterium arseniciresistens]|uniref:Helix-turn-helix domain-containing protein n=1 Tax=Mycolicibacterium arseniciresistens TaxID=3062257 RepID=A0ABT8U8P9_9MYCO|nr:TetR/AcrR family transcriptional regulator [Mycolicibacterium arseniciresistens]MDO3634157.1 helix-turn-helix domain-containing protein [Mycolicibacterium arseniciresistens]
MVERWTRQRRLEHTRSLLLDAAEQVFAKQGFGGAALEDIAEVAGYTRGAIYSHFGAKEELFLAVIERHRLRLLTSFADVLSSFEGLDTLDIEKLAERWRELTIAGPDGAALGLEFSLFLLRNPDARERLMAQREETISSLAEYITVHVEQLGGTLDIPARTLARILLASNEGVTISGHLDGEDLYGPFLRLVMANITPKAAPVRKPRSRRTS